MKCICGGESYDENGILYTCNFVRSFYGWLAISFGISSISTIVFVWIALFLVCGFLLSKEKFWGGILGILPGIHLIYMSTKDSGQVINIEFPLGVIILIFYILCSGLVFYKKRKTGN
ncbi:hypothetical protein [Sporosarcina sp. ACRSL]|uniref:hypothetical protein n=1 Tax=Sporosarcina sp. ACRSL TaxID=2918215 RepID=UPI001EF3E684|nr:hypothetical protein [Sporosarcina sp. ACRSL]